MNSLAGWLLQTLSRTNRFSWSQLIRWDSVVCSHWRHCSSHWFHALTGEGLSVCVCVCVRARSHISQAVELWVTQTLVNEHMQTNKCIWCHYNPEKNEDVVTDNWIICVHNQ